MVRCALPLAGMISAAVLYAPTADAEVRIATAGPMTGAYAWFGEQYQRGVGLAVEDLNAKGGVLGQSVELIVGDDFCDPEQAVALARKLVSDGVVFVAGHWCLHSSIPASKVYEAAEILMIAPGAISSKLTDKGGPNVFRVCGRDDRQGAMVGDYLADHWAGKKIAILNDRTTFGAGLANAVRRRLHERGVRAAMDEAYTPGEADYFALVSKMQAAGIDVVFVGGYHPETGLILRETHDRGYDLRLIANSAMATTDFPMIMGPTVEGTVMVAATDMRKSPEAAEAAAADKTEQGEEPASDAAAGVPIQVNDSTFEAKVLNSPLPVLVDFWAEWAGPSKRIAPVVADLARDLSGKVMVAKLNVDDNPLTLTKYGVRAIPTLMLFKDGQVAAARVGGGTKDQLYTWLENNLGDEANVIQDAR